MLKKLNRYSLYFIAGLLFLTQEFVVAQGQDEKLPVDPKVKIGVLANGLTYYIRQNKKPEQKIELRLVVNAGSILEDEDQQGLAHLNEHMAFDGTTHFKKHDIISFLQTIGVSFGNDLNAYTSFDETVYILPIPTDKPGNIEKGFQILEDWAHNVTDKAEDIDAERPVVLEESRLGKGAEERIQRKLYPKVFAGSLYSRRLPIGIDSIVKNSSYESIRRFYREWYRPDLMAVVVVGDIDPVKAEEMINKYFVSLSNPTKERARNIVEVPMYDKTEAMVVTDKEATNYVAEIHYSSIKSHPSTTLSDYKQDIIKEIFTTLLNQRLRELTQQENPPFLFAATGFENFARGYESFNAQVVASTSNAKRPIQSFLEELERVKMYGFTDGELIRAKKDLLTASESAFNERNKSESANFAAEYIRNFLKKEPIPGIEVEYGYYKKLLPQIALTEVNNVASFLKENNNKFISFSGPEPSGKSSLPTGEDLITFANGIDQAAIKPYEEKVVSSELLNKTPVAGRIVSTTKNALSGTTEFTLSNGVTVTLKSTDFKNDQVLMSAVRGGGKSNYGLKDKYNAEYATSVITSMGIGAYSPVDLRKVLAGKTANVSASFGSHSEGISGNSSVKDMETMLQLMYLYFTSPRKDTSLFRSFIQKSKSQTAFLGANPEVAFIDTLYKVIFNNNPLTPIAIPKSEYFDKIDLDRVMQIYKERFGDANGMHFIFVGSCTPEQIIPLIEKYIASLPSTSKKYSFKDNNVRPVRGRVNLTVYKGKEQKSLIVSIYSGSVPYNELLQLKANAVSEILNIRIIEDLREKIQGIYDGSIILQFEKVPYSHYAYFLQIPCGPEKVDTLLNAMNKEIEDLIKFGPSQLNLDKIKQQWLEQQKVGLKDNNAWLAELIENKFPGNDIHYFTDFEKYVKAITVKDVQDAAKLLLNGQNVIRGVLMPEKKNQF